MGHRYSRHRHCHSYDYGHCHGYSRPKICGYTACCCHHPRLVLNPSMAGILWMSKRRHRKKMREMQLCECGGYVIQPNIPPPRPPPPALSPPQSYSPITPYPQVPAGPSSSSSNIQRAENPYRPMPELGFSRSVFNPQQQVEPPRSRSPPPPYDYK